ncbi:hypothetical protein ACIOKD_20465 [Streptomyces sp. NPDC087844]|uniref:hypothetical protein n=1 Tax=Streptomyces sp. NPDC087844 TaxID=3365805 RepID=UPI0037F8C57C
MTGARSTTDGGLHPFWRDVRIRTLHDLVAYQRREVGRWGREGELPGPRTHLALLTAHLGRLPLAGTPVPKESQ